MRNGTTCPPAVVVWLAAALALAACSFAPPKDTSVMQATGVQSDLHAEQIRLRVRALVHPLSGAVEEAADRVIRESNESGPRREALIWKIDAVPAVREALFRPDPYAALLDAWALGIQMSNYFDAGPGAERLGAWTPLAMQASRRIVTDVSNVTGKIFGEEARERSRAAVEQWAAAHPIENTIAGRETVLNQVADIALKVNIQGTKLIGNMAITLDDLNRKLSVYSEQLVKQWRWQVELLAMDAGGDADLRATLERLPPLLDRLQGTLAAVADAPDLLARERAALLLAIHDDLEEVLERISEERVEVLTHLTQERNAVMEQVSAAGLEAADRLRAEIEEAMAQISIEREMTLRDAEAIMMRTIDHAYYRAAQLVGAVLVALLALLALAAWLFRRRAAARPTPGGN